MRASLLALSVLLVAVGISACTYNFDPSTRPLPDRGDVGTGESALLDVADRPTDMGFDSSDVPTIDIVDTIDAPDAIDARDVVDAPDLGPCGVCSAGDTCCGTQCVNLNTAPQHCGACDNPCPGTTCQGGSCTSVCLLGFADCDHNGVNGCETDLRTDNSNCGACGVTCGTGRSCVSGVCACPTGMADCDGNPTNGCEVSTITDSQHCGRCTVACASNQVCTAGACVCATGFGDCNHDPTDGCEVDLSTSSANCGACAHGCGSNAVCHASACACTPGFLECTAGSSDCSTPTSDPNNCGACGVVCPAAMPVCGGTGCTIACPSGMASCGGGCVDTQANVSNCGGCGAVCSTVAHGTATCAMGACGFTCETGFADCNAIASDGCEVDTTSDVNNCGACGTACGAGHACVSGHCVCTGGLRDCGGGVCAACCNDSQCASGNPCSSDRCAGGTCSHTLCGGGTICCGSACRACCSDADCPAALNRGCGSDGTCSVCLAGFADCDGVATNGCETNTQTSVANCGTCGAGCSFPNAAATCAGGSCSMGACASGFADCNHIARDGCEVNLATSVANCGACGTVCSFPGASAVCTMGVCQRSTCSPGLADCDGNTANGCETNIQTSIANCGACGNACAFANAMATCASGVCALGPCNAGFGNCDANAANGCEVDTRTSVANCGACATACSLPNATPACSGGSCVIAACTGSMADCDRVASNGCETNVQTSLANCGACGVACPTPANATPNCTAGACGFTCNAGFGDCDGNPANGCESNFATSASNCGSCGHACTYPNATGVCSARVCGFGACQAGFADCNGSTADGCEQSIFNVNHCGSCTNVCMLPHATPGCPAGSCTVSACAAGYADCNGVASDGCELECGATRTCSAGACSRGWITMATSPLAARAYTFFAVAPSRRELIVWGGRDATTTYADGARYNWDTNTWTMMAAAPISARSDGMAVWTGTQLFVFGGRNGFTSLNDGALYDPNANTWTVIAGSGRPSTRSGFFAYWNGSRAVVVGGIGAGGTSLRDVHLYDPVGASWTTGNSASVSAARAGVTTSSTQAFMLGGDTAGDCSAGSESNATQIASMPTPTWTNGTNVPGARFFGALLACSPDEWRAPWIETTGEVFMWGGVASGAYLASGSLYRPSDDTSHAIAAAPAPLAGGGFLPTAVWTGSVVLGWSASIPGTPTPTAVDVVYSYDPVANSWSVLNPSGGPAPIHEGPAYGWTGHELVVWGGRSGASTYSAQGARYAP